MKGNFHVQFLGEGVAATSPPYPTLGGQPPRSTRPGDADPGDAASRRPIVNKQELIDGAKCYETVRTMSAGRRKGDKQMSSRPPRA